MDLHRLDPDLLRSGGWADAAGDLAGALRGPGPGPLLLGTPDVEPWHFTAHLADEARWSGRPEAAPTLVRWAPPPGAPPHLAVGLDRLTDLRRGASLLVSVPGQPGERLLERVADVRRRGATVLAVADDDELATLAHEALRPDLLVGHDLAEHLVSLAVGTVVPGRPARSGLRDRLARLVRST